MPISIDHDGEPMPVTIGRVEYNELYVIVTSPRPDEVGRAVVYNGVHLIMFFENKFRALDTGHQLDMTFCRAGGETVTIT